RLLRESLVVDALRGGHVRGGRCCLRCGLAAGGEHHRGRNEAEDESTQHDGPLHEPGSVRQVQTVRGRSRFTRLPERDAGSTLGGVRAWNSPTNGCRAERSRRRSLRRWAALRTPGGGALANPVLLDVSAWWPATATRRRRPHVAAPRAW